LRVARRASRAAVHKSLRQEGKTATTVMTVTTVTDMHHVVTTVATVVAVATVAGATAGAGNRLWRVIGDAQNAAVTISLGGWSALTAKHRSAAEPPIASVAPPHETGMKIAAGGTATAMISDPAPGHATGGGGVKGKMPGVVMTGEVEVAAVAVAGVEVE